MATVERKEDLLLFSEKYQDRITRQAVLDPTRLKALRLWQDEINRILALPISQRLTERKLHEQFLTDMFVSILGYTKRRAGQEHWTLESEYTTDVDRTRPDGVLGFFGAEHGEKNIQVVIELKGPGTDLDLRQNRKQDRRTPVDQAFSYAHKYDDVGWVIVSNYSELRLYKANSSKYAVHFDLTRIADDERQLKLFFLLLSRDNLLQRDGDSISDRIFIEREEELQRITREFYNDYKNTRLKTAEHILKNSPDKNVDHAVGLAQTILDRILFIAFLEDFNLIPHDTIAKAFETRNPFNPAPVWENFKGLFKAMDLGSEPLSIPAYNGGLFQENAAIQSLSLDDDVLER